MSEQSGGEKPLLQRLLQQVCQSVQWCQDPGTSVAERLDTALTAHAVHVWTPEVDLHARLTEDVSLAIAVRVRGWSDAAEAALSSALDKDTSLLAALVRTEWKLVRTACKAADRTAGKMLLLTTVPEA